MADPTTTIRVGVLCNGTTFERWQADAIRHVLDVQGVELVVLVVNDKKAGTDRSFLHKLTHYPFRTALYRQYRRRWSKPNAMVTEDLSDLFQTVPQLKCITQGKGVVDRFDQEDLNAISDYQPDVLLRFGFNILQGGILGLATHGVWSFHHGDPTKFRGGPPAFWEIMEGDPITGAVLQRLSESLDAGQILRQGWFKTIDHGHTETVDAVLSNSAIWPAQVMRELLAGNTAAATGPTPIEKGKLYRYPGNFKFLGFLRKRMANKARFHSVELNRHEEWNIGILPRPIETLLDDDPSLNVRWLPAPGAGTFRADPFGYIAPDGALNVLYEKFEHSSNRGEIARIRPKPDNTLKRSRTMLQTEKHLSYPYVVTHNDTVYVIPESAAEGNVSLHRVNGANDGLEFVKVLLEEPLFDPTVFQHEGRWWLMGTKAPLTNVTLYAYWSNDLQGPYTAHELNPIKFDIRSARPGGTPFRKGSDLWRPAQDSSKTYGGRIAMNRVLVLTPDQYKEETVSYVEPFKNTHYGHGVHTISAIGDMTLVDGKRYVTVPERKKAIRTRKLQKLNRKRLE